MNAVIGLMVAAALLTAYGVWSERMLPRPTEPETNPPTISEPGADMSRIAPVAAHLAWRAGALATFVYLTFFDGYSYNGWNWIIAVFANAFLGAIWPIYWLILRPIMG